MSLFKVEFEDNSNWNGGDFINSKWNEMPNKNIKSIEYTFLNKKIKLEGYNSYNNIIERAFFMGKDKTRISKLMILAEKDNNIIKFIYDFCKREFYIEQIEKDKEYNGKPVSGWKAGINLDKPTYNII